MRSELFCLWNKFVASLKEGPQRYKARSLPLAQRKDINHHDHIMDSSLACARFDAAGSIAGRLSFSQILLLTTYMFLRSCLPFRMGDDRQILDILRREERDWQPRIGSDGFSELMSLNHDIKVPRVNGTWEEVRNALIQDHCQLRVSAQDLRDQLRYILHKLEQISSEGLNTITEKGKRLPPPKKPFGSRGTMVLLCFSLSAVPSGTLPPVHWEPDDATTDMVRHLNQSPLFRGGISLHELRTALASLELLFSCEDDRVTDFQRQERKENEKEREDKKGLKRIRSTYELLSETKGGHNYCDLETGDEELWVTSTIATGQSHEFLHRPVFPPDAS